MKTAKKENDDGRSAEQAQAQYESIVEMVAALECDYDRLADLQDEKPKWVAGYNIAGYLPDNDPALFADFDTARDYIVDKINESAAESLDNATEIVGLGAAFADSMEQELSQQCADGYVYWINKIGDDEAILAGWDDFDEYKELTEAAGDCESREDAEQRIQDDPLGIEIRSNWHEPGGDNTPGEFCILLCTGGPAVRIRGELDEHREPCRAWLEHQDWGTPWREHFIAGGQEMLLTYARCFYFGE